LELRNQLLLARQHPSAKGIHVEPSRARLSENPADRFSSSWTWCSICSDSTWTFAS
jgi:hypothetical protein